MLQLLDAENAQKAALYLERRCEECPAEAGAFMPVVDLAKCEGKSDCVAVCPCGVFEVRRIDDGDFASLSLLGKLKSVAHGRQTAYTPNAADCEACGLCVVACPERAIRLIAGTGTARSTAVLGP